MCPNAETTDPTPVAPSGKRERLQSSIQFPYGDLQMAIDVAKAMHNGGYQECAPDQLAAALRQRASSGNFRHKASTARIFGLIETSPGRISLTDLGYSVLDPVQEKKALVEAFLSVELYRKLYDDFRGRPLPPRPAALERTFETYGVSPKQTDKARQAFDRSAQQAGFFIHGNTRLVMPGGLDMPTHPSPGTQEASEAPTVGRASGNGGRGGGSGDIPPYLDPLIAALLRKMPEGTKWLLSDQVKWLRALAINLSFVYEAEDQETGEIQISIQKGSSA